MNEYVKVFGWFTLSVDVITLLVSCWCVYHNAKYLLNYTYKIKDVPFRLLMTGMTSYYLLANSEALKRHIDTFIIKNSLILSEDMVGSLLTDRCGMLIVSGFMILLTCKYVPEWYDK